jgi:hypothetical protein
MVHLWPLNLRSVAASLLVLFASVVRGQSPYPTTTTPLPAGGYALPESVPYQPTLGAPVVAPIPQGPATWIGPTPAAQGPAYMVPVAPGANGAVMMQTLPAGGVVLPSDPNAPPPVVSGPWQPYPPGNPTVPAGVPVPPATVPFPDQPSPNSLAALAPPGSRNGFFQKVNFTATYLPRFGDQDLGMTDLETQVVLAVPFLTVDTPLLITPKYGYHALDGPDSPDVPSNVQDAALDLENIRPFGDRWIGIFDVTLGEFADNHSFGSGDAFRVTGNGTAIYVFSPELKGVLGVAYINRVETKFLPIFGVDWKPSDDAEYQLVFPSAKLAWRLSTSPIPGQDEHWLYLAGDFGGGVWAVERTSGETDKLDITDWRISLGLEHRVIGGLSERAEIGFAFNRRLEYFSDHDRVELGNTLLARIGVTY